MSQHLRSSSPIQPLSIGNVITAAFRLYRSHFKQYFSLTFIAVLWLLIPIYGWAKYHTINALVSRLAFSELIDRPESVNTARNHVNSLMWKFLFTQLLVFLILFLTNLCLSILQAMVSGVIAMLVNNNSSVTTVVGLLLFICTFAAYTWVYSRFFIPELPLAIEHNIDAKQALSRSWELTKGHVLRLQGVIIIASLITLPIIVFPVILAGFFFAMSVPAMAASNSAPAFFGLFFLAILGLILFILASVFVTSLWQAIKAVVYYDLRSRQEGLDLKFRKRTT